VRELEDRPPARPVPRSTATSSSSESARTLPEELLARTLLLRQRRQAACPRAGGRLRHELSSARTISGRTSEALVRKLPSASGAIGVASGLISKTRDPARAAMRPSDEAGLRRPRFRPRGRRRSKAPRPRRRARRVPGAFRRTRRRRDGAAPRSGGRAAEARKGRPGLRRHDAATAAAVAHDRSVELDRVPAACGRWSSSTFWVIRVI